MNMGTTSTMTMGATTTGSMTTATSSSSSSSSMDGSSTAMGMSSMAMTFFTSFKTPLFAVAWTPSTTGQYGGTCIFLVALAVILRILIAFKPILETRFWSNDGSYSMPSHGHAGNTSSEMIEEDSAANQYAKRLLPGARLRAMGHDVSRRWSGWRIGVAAQRATYELFIVGVGYLLMLAVMTMNVGYFLSVLAGAWFGTFMLGALANDIQWAHC